MSKWVWIAGWLVLATFEKSFLPDTQPKPVQISELAWGKMISRRLRPGETVEFFRFDPRSPQDVKELQRLNQGIFDYIRRHFGITVTAPASSVLLHGTEMRSYGSYRIRQKIAQQEYDIVVKQADDFIKNGFLKASELDVAPENAEFIFSGYRLDPVTTYETEGYVISRYFEGERLSEFIFDKAQIQTLLNNSWIFEQLGIKVARLKKAGIEYGEYILPNILVNIETRDLRIVGYGNFEARNPIEQIYTFIYSLLRQQLREHKKDLAFADIFWLVFKNAYNSQLPAELHIKR